MTLNQYFDKIYVLNLLHRVDRKQTTLNKLKEEGIDVQFFAAYDGRLMTPMWQAHRKTYGHFHFENPNYLACAMSHLAMYQNAIDNGYERILILEDDNAVLKNTQPIWNNLQQHLPKDWQELLYLGWIPLNDDQSQWTYLEIEDRMLNPHVIRAHNMWGLYAYGIHRNLMEEILDSYNYLSAYPMELDRYFVKYVQPRGNSFAITPQLFAATDGPSDNSGRNETGMLVRSTHRKWAQLEDYI